MIQLTQGGAYLVNGTDIVADTPEAASQIQAKTGITISKEEAAKNTMAYGILQEHNTSGNMDKLKIRFDKLTSHGYYLCRYYPDRESIRTAEVPHALCTDQLS